MDYRDALQDVLEYVDAHIRDNLNADILAAQMGFSPYHFCRVFQWSIGYSVMDYVRSRRLAFAAAELSGGRRIIDIAMDYGFETHSGFSKAFRRHFGCPPETYRMHAYHTIPALPSLNKMNKYAIGGIVMEPKFVTQPQTKLVGYVLKTKTGNGENNKAIPAFWTAYMTDGRMDKLHAQPFVKSHNEYGACFPKNPETGEFEYMIGIEPVDGAHIPDGYEVREMPAATYAVFTTPPTDDANFPSTIQGVWQYIFSEWFSNSGYEFAADCIDYELYDERCMSDAGKVCDIYIPVSKKA